MTPAQYAVEIVMPTVRDFMKARGDRRPAYLACITTYHLVDYLARAEAVERATVTATMGAACPNEFDVVEGICNLQRL
jgi:hypothetical protein